MSLNRDVLKGALAPFFVPATMPSGQQSVVVGKWISAYITYARSALAAVTSPVGLSATSVDGGDFIGSLDASLRSMWQSTAWVGPGVTGSTSFVPPLRPIMLPTMQRLQTSRDADLALTLIVDALHTYTLGIVVTIIPSSGTPFTVSLL